MNATDGVSVRKTNGEGVILLHLSGVINESFDAAQLFGELAPNLVLDLDGVKRITSFGVRQWSEAMKALSVSIRHLYLVRCAPCFVDQLNIVLNFGGRAEVITATTIYYCAQCQEERFVLVDVLSERAQLMSGHLSPAACPQCKTPMQLEDDLQTSFRFVGPYGAKTLDPPAAAILAKEGLYEVREQRRAAEEVKLVHGDVTLVRLGGVLDSRFRPRRLASGVEGQVVIDLGGVESADEAGAANWQRLLDVLGQQAASNVIVDLPASLFTQVVEGKFSLADSKLYSVRVTYRCSSCGNETSAPLRAKEIETGGVTPCARCGQPSPLTIDRALLPAVFARAVADDQISPAVAQVIEQRAELLSRARVQSGEGARGDFGSALSRYRVLRPLTRGGMAEILLAVHEGIGGFEKLIVLKKIRRQMLEKKHVAIELFLNEAKIAANLNHPNIVQIFEVGEHGGDLFIAMEYVHGADARDIIRRGLAENLQISLDQILYLGAQVAGALHHAHTARDLNGRQLEIVHRDVSLSNIVIGFDGQVKLVDFGIATASVVTAKDGLIGKFSYMSPEQIAKQPLDGRSDVFSLGIVLYELITGKPLFRRESSQQTLAAVREDPIPSLAAHGVPAEVEQVLLRALTRPRDQRYADARAFQQELENCLRARKSTVNSHELSLFMKQLFGAESAAPVATAAGSPSWIPSDPSGSTSSGSTGSQSYRLSDPPWEARGEDPSGEPQTSPGAAQPEAQSDKTVTPPFGVAARARSAPPAEAATPVAPTAPVVPQTGVTRTAPRAMPWAPIFAVVVTLLVVLGVLFFRR